MVGWFDWLVGLIGWSVSVGWLVRLFGCLVGSIGLIGLWVGWLVGLVAKWVWLVGWLVN